MFVVRIIPCPDFFKRIGNSTVQIGSRVVNVVKVRSVKFRFPVEAYPCPDIVLSSIGKKRREGTGNTAVSFRNNSTILGHNSFKHLFSASLCLGKLRTQRTVAIWRTRNGTYIVIQSSKLFRRKRLNPGKENRKPRSPLPLPPRIGSFPFERSRVKYTSECTIIYRTNPDSIGFDIISEAVNVPVWMTGVT